MENNKKLIAGKNLIAGILAVAGGCALLIYGKARLNAYLIVVFSLMILLGFLLIEEAIRKRNDAPVDKIHLRELVLIVLLFINPLLAKTIGFYLSAYLEIALISLLIEKELSVKTVLKSLLVSLVILICGYLIFTVALKIHTPSGALHLI